MSLTDLPIQAEPVRGAMPAFRASIEPGKLRAVVEKARSKKARLVALGGSDETTRGAALHLRCASRRAPVADAAARARAPALSCIADIYPCANRMQRAAYDLLGIHAQDSPDRRKWVRHRAWPGGVFPLRKEFDIGTSLPASDDCYPFVKVEGEGVHEIPVGPVHAGTIEPGHFRFSIVGEKILRLEERLCYTHKGIEKLFETMNLAEGAKLAARVSGDSTVAYAWAYAMAVEGASGTEPPSRALGLRGIMLELERIANHLGDLGYLANDVGLSFGFFQFWRLKEDLLRLQGELFGHRYLMDQVIPGGVARDLPRDQAERLLARLEQINRIIALKAIYDDTPARDRFIMAGRAAGTRRKHRLAIRQTRERRQTRPARRLSDSAVPTGRGAHGHAYARRCRRARLNALRRTIQSMRLVQVLAGELAPGGIRFHSPTATPENAASAGSAGAAKC